MGYRINPKEELNLTKNSKKFLETLATLCGHKGAPEASTIGPADVAKKAHLKRSSLAGYMTPLYNQGLIARVEKGTKRFLQLTAQGWKLMESKN